jgi:hypothetical protein
MQKDHIIKRIEGKKKEEKTSKNNERCASSLVFPTN